MSIHAVLARRVVAAVGMSEPEESPYLTVRDAARYLHLNEKKIYALIQEGRIPATRATGKWLFPRQLLDNWLIETSHGGVLADRLVICGADDALLRTAVALAAIELGDEGLMSYSPCTTRLGLSQLARRRATVAAIHWGAAREAPASHAALLREWFAEVTVELRGDAVARRITVLACLTSRERDVIPGVRDGGAGMVRLDRERAG